MLHTFLFQDWGVYEFVLQFTCQFRDVVFHCYLVNWKEQRQQTTQEKRNKKQQLKRGKKWQKRKGLATNPRITIEFPKTRVKRESRRERTLGLNTLTN